MTNEQIDEIIRQVRADETADLERRLALLSQRLRETNAQAVARPADRPELISLAEAAKRARLSKTRMRAVCGKHLHGTPGGFGHKLGARWHVVDGDAFRDWLQRRASV